MMKTRRWTALLVLAAMAAGVFTYVWTPRPFEAVEATSIDAYPWTMVGFRPAGATATRPFDDATRELIFDEGRVAGRICNTFSGVLTLENGRIEADQVVSTKMACEDGLMQAEYAFFQGLASGMAYEIVEDYLRLQDAAGNVFLFEGPRGHSEEYASLRQKYPRVRGYFW